MKHEILIVALLGILAGCDNRSAEQIGKDLAQKKVDLVKGVGEVVKDQGEGVANTVAQGVGNVISGVTKGFDESLIKKEIRLDEALQRQLSVSRAQRIRSNPSERHDGLTLYIVSEPGIKQKMVLVAYADGVEVGRSSADVEVDKNSASYVDFEFDERTPFTSVEYYTLKPAG